MSDQAPGRRNATLKDVAQLAGVSTATIARVIHGKGYVAEETRRVVETALAESGYRLNAVAQGLRKQRTFLLGHIVRSIVPNPFFASVALGVQQEAARLGCDVIVVNTQDDADRERSSVEAMLQRRVDAILFTSGVDEANVRLAAESDVPVVQIERVVSLATHAVTVDNYRGSCEATAHLIALGHQRIAFIGLDPRTPMHPAPGTDDDLVPERRSIDQERLSGYLDALRSHGLTVRPDLVDLGDDYYSPERGWLVAERLLALAADERPTAIFVGCDLLAAGVLQAVYDRCWRVPDDLSVVGFDDTYARFLAPPLTTVEQPMLELGHTAARMAIEVLREGQEASVPRRERLATRLIVRASTGPPPIGSEAG